MTIPRRKDKADWTSEDFFQNAKDGIEPLNPAYVEARREALKAADLEPETEPSDKTIGEMSPSDHLERIRSR